MDNTHTTTTPRFHIDKQISLEPYYWTGDLVSYETKEDIILQKLDKIDKALKKIRKILNKD